MNLLRFLALAPLAPMPLVVRRLRIQRSPAPLDRTRGHGGTNRRGHRARGPSFRSVHRRRVRGSLEERQHGHDVAADLRRPRDFIDRRRRDRAFESGYRLGRDGRAEQPAELEFRLWRLQVGRRRRHVPARGSRAKRPYRSGGGAPSRPAYGVRRRARAPLVRRRRARGFSHAGLPARRGRACSSRTRTPARSIW